MSYKEKIRYTRIHRLVAEAFIPNPKNKPFINHIDCNKQNNCIKNLEWVTARENVIHSVKHNPNSIKAMNDYNKNRRIPVFQYSLSGEFIKEYLWSREASQETGICERNILMVANGEEYKKGLKRKQAGGYIWKRKEVIS